MHAFVGDLTTGRVSGNPCSVIIGAQDPGQAPIPPDPTITTTHCYTWQTGERTAHVRCFTSAGKEIQCCGHGLLSCASVWTSHWDAAGVLRSGHVDILCRQNHGQHWLGFPRQTQAQDKPIKVEVPKWLPALLGAPALQCYNVGGSQGYLIAQFATGYDLRQLQPPGDTLGRYTHRALIVTNRTQTQQTDAGEHFHFRYFAPQYDVPEDAATGSAMRLLTPFWQQGDETTPALALQRSPAGGWLHGYSTRDRVWIGGNVEREPDGRV